MIFYDTNAWFGYRYLFRVRGSCIFSWRSFSMGAISGILCAFAVYRAQYIRDRSHPVAYFQSTFVVVTILLIFRCKMAYERYMEARSHLQVIISKLEDAGSHAKAFVRADTPTAQLWRYNMSHLLFAYLALMWADFQEPSLGRVMLEDLTTRWELRIQKRVLEDIQKNESVCRASILNSWLVNYWVEAEVGGLVMVAPPVLSRTYHIMSEVHAAYEEALMVATTPFPFPFMQVCGVLLHIYVFTGPLVIGSWVESYYLGAMLSFVSVVCLFALDRCCEELEDPFGDDQNDVDMEIIVHEFHEGLEMLDIGTMPAKARWFQLKTLLPSILEEQRARDALIAGKNNSSPRVPSSPKKKNNLWKRARLLPSLLGYPQPKTRIHCSREGQERGADLNLREAD